MLIHRHFIKIHKRKPRSCQHRNQHGNGDADGQLPGSQVAGGVRTVVEAGVVIAPHGFPDAGHGQEEIPGVEGQHKIQVSGDKPGLAEKERQKVAHQVDHGADNGGGGLQGQIPERQRQKIERLQSGEKHVFQPVRRLPEGVVGAAVQHFGENVRGVIALGLVGHHTAVSGQRRGIGTAQRHSEGHVEAAPGFPDGVGQKSEAHHEADPAGDHVGFGDPGNADQHINRQGQGYQPGEDFDIPQLFQGVIDFGEVGAPVVGIAHILFLRI